MPTLNTGWGSSSTAASDGSKIQWVTKLNMNEHFDIMMNPVPRETEYLHVLDDNRITLPYTKYGSRSPYTSAYPLAQCVLPNGEVKVMLYNDITPVRTNAAFRSREEFYRFCFMDSHPAYKELNKELKWYDSTTNLPFQVRSTNQPNAALEDAYDNSIISRLNAVYYENLANYNKLVLHFNDAFSASQKIDIYKNIREISNDHSNPNWDDNIFFNDVNQKLPSPYWYERMHKFYLNGGLDSTNHCKFILDTVRATHDALLINDIQPNSSFEMYAHPNRSIVYRTYVYETWDGRLFYSYNEVAKHLNNVGVPQHADYNTLPNLYHEFGYSAWEIVRTEFKSISGSYQPWEFEHYNLIHRYPMAFTAKHFYARVHRLVDPDPNNNARFVDNIAIACVDDLVSLLDKGEITTVQQDLLDSISDDRAYIDKNLGGLLLAGIERYDIPFIREVKEGV